MWKPAYYEQRFGNSCSFNIPDSSIGAACNVVAASRIANDMILVCIVNFNWIDMSSIDQDVLLFI